MKEDSSRKIKISSVFVAFLVFFLIVLLKAAFIQVIPNESLINYSKNQIIREATVYPNRGNIYDRSHSPLAINIKTYDIFALPKQIANDSTYRTLEKIVSKSKLKKIINRIKKRKSFTWIARRIRLDSAVVSELSALKGIFLEEVPHRIYPNKELMSQVLGFVGLDNSGLEGVEYAFDAKLKGTPHKVRYIQDAKGRPVKIETKETGDQGQDIVLSIDKDLQAVAERYLQEAVVEHEADGGGIGVMDPETGEILAVANYPTFDPNEIKKSIASQRRLSFFTDPIEPGSTLKVLTISGAIDSKISRPDTHYFCEYGKFKIGTHTINEAESKKQFEWLSVEEILQHSSNIGTTKIAFELGAKKLIEYFTAFGLGSKSGIEIAGESRGIFPELNELSPLRLSNVSFGQGIAVTGIQMLSAISTIANNGVYVAPTIIITKDRKINSRVVVSPETAKTMTGMMVKAVEQGTGANARVPFFTIAGKTSTAQRPSADGGYKGYVSGFVGFPVNTAKKFVAYVYIENPKKGGYYGNLVAAPAFKKVAEYLLYKDKDYYRYASTEKNDGSKVEDNVSVKSSSLNFSKGIMPDFRGLDKKTAQTVLNLSGIEASHFGAGIIKNQSPTPGTHLGENDKVELHYEPPTAD